MNVPTPLVLAVPTIGAYFRRLDVNPPNSDFKERCVGFILGSAFILALLIDWKDVEKISLGHPIFWVPLTLIGALLLVALYKENKSRAFWFGSFALMLAPSTLVVLPYFDLSAGEESRALLALATALLMLTVFRVGVAWYLAVSIAIGMVIGKQENFSYGFLSFVGAAATWALLNYAVKLVLDHREELAKAWTLEGEEKRRGAILAIALMTPAFILVAAGLYIHSSIQTQLMEIPYSSATVLGEAPLISEACGNSPDVVKNADKLQEDLLCASNEQKEIAQMEVAELIDGGAAAGVAVTASTPAAVAGGLAKLRPRQIDSGPACSGFVYGNKFVKLSFTTPCRVLVAYINDALAGTYNRMAQSINGATSDLVNKSQSGIEENQEDLKTAARNEVEVAFKQLEDSIKAAFVIWRVVEALGLAALFIALLAAFQMILGRVLFDRSKNSFIRQPMGFQLVPGVAKPISSVRCDNLPLSNESDCKSDVWYVNLNVARHGEGTALDICIPQPFSCVLNRIFSGNYLQTRVEANDSSKAVISIAGDTKLVRVDVKAGQSLCFRMSDLLAFTRGVSIRSRYNTHTGTHILKLGQIYSVATGAGVLVLRSEGSKIAEMKKGESSPPTNLLVWDETHEFSLEQRLGLGIWINRPSVVSKSVAGAAIIDEGATERFPLLARAWELLRFLFLPF